MNAPGRLLVRPARLRLPGALLAVLSAAVLAWLWLIEPVAAVAASLMFVAFLAGEGRRMRAVMRVERVSLAPDGILTAQGRDGRLHATRRPALLPGVVLARMAGQGVSGFAVAITPGSAGPDAFRRLVVELRESARRDGASPHGAIQAR